MLRNTARLLADALPNGRSCTLAGQTHDIAPDVTAAVLVDFLSSEKPG